MTILQRTARGAAATLALVALGACTNTGSLGGVLGSVLGGTPSQVSGSVRTVDTRNQQITLRQSNGQDVVVNYDSQTRVVYQNQNYSVTSLEYGDVVTARLQSNNNSNSYYTDLVQVDQPVNNTTGTTSNEVVQTLQGTVRTIDTNNGSFVVDASSNVRLTVTLPYNVSRTDANKFNALRAGDFVRLEGVFLNSSRVELRRFTN